MNYGPAEFQNPDERLWNIRQIGCNHEFCQKFAKRAERVHNWPEHCLLGVFLSGLKEELKSDLHIHKPRMGYKAMSLVLEFEVNTNPTRGLKGSNRFPSTRQNASSSFTRAPRPRDTPLSQPAVGTNLLASFTSNQLATRPTPLGF